jgi:hypothetical protein
MEVEREDEVRARAHAIWEREGRPEGGAEQHWAQAEEELRADGDGRAEASAVEAARTAAEAERAASPHSRRSNSAARIAGQEPERRGWSSG